MSEANKETAPAFTETPEFQVAVDKAAAAAVDKVMAGLSSGTANAPSGQEKAWAESLALAFAKLSEQGTGKRYIAPEILQARATAREHMMDLIIAARKAGKLPAYQLTAKVLLDNQLVEPMWVDSTHIARPTEIDWPGIPNDAMIPLNDVATEIHQAYRDSVGTTERVVPEDRLGVTAKGLVVRNNAVSKAINRDSNGMAAFADRIHDESGEVGLSLRHKDAPGRVVERRILGSIAPPARQTA